MKEGHGVLKILEKCPAPAMLEDTIPSRRT